MHVLHRPVETAAKSGHLLNSEDLSPTYLSGNPQLNQEI